jgi:D-sedoheptulose 7-phosphate isomerase
MEGAIAKFVEREFAASLSVVSALYGDAKYRENAAAVGTLFVETLKAGQKLLFAGNGGSAADAQHMAGEFVSRFHFDRPGLPAISLATDTSILTAIGNDYGYDQVFSRQIEAIGQRGDVFVAISTSGNSRNIITAIKAARAKEITVVGLTGGSGGEMAPLCDHVLLAPSPSTPRIQECHLITYHLLCGFVEEAIFGKSDLFASIAPAS